VQIKSYFNRDPKLIYLNTGTHSLVPRPVLEALVSHLYAFEQNPTQSLIDAPARLWGIQRQIAQVFHANPQDLFLRANVTEALNAFILGMPLRAPGEILVSDLEYGAVVNLCEFRARRDGLTLRRFTVDESAPLAGLAAALSARTQMVVVSHVMTGTGLVFPITEAAKLTKAHGALLVVDGAHGAGALELGFSKLTDVDFYGSNFHKWMLGPKGTGFGWVPERHHEQLAPLTAGWTTFESKNSFGSFGDGNRFAGKMLMPGCHDLAPFYALSELLQFWQNVCGGFRSVASNLLELRRTFVRLMDQSLGWPLLSPKELTGPLLSFELPERLALEGYGLGIRLSRDHGLQIATPSVRDRAVLRVSPHLYNDELEMKRAVEILASL